MGTFTCANRKDLSCRSRDTGGPVPEDDRLCTRLKALQGAGVYLHLTLLSGDGIVQDSARQNLILWLKDPWFLALVLRSNLSVTPRPPKRWWSIGKAAPFLLLATLPVPSGVPTPAPLPPQLVRSS